MPCATTNASQDLCDILQVAKHHRTQRDQSFDEEMKELEHLQQRLGTFDAKVGNVHQELESREYEVYFICQVILSE